MGGNRNKAGSGTQGKSRAESRKERLAAALRANLKRRKQARAGGPGRAEDKKPGGRNTDG